MTRILSWNIYFFGWMIVGLFAIYLIIASVSVYYAILFMLRPGISHEARQMVMRRHMSYIAVNVLC